jgi:dTDP-4-dehydrorhamnose reductase
VSSRPRILITGARGQLGTELRRSLAGMGEVIAADRTSLDLFSEEQIRNAVSQASPDFIVNAAAYTAVDKAESETDRAHAINAVAPRILAEEALRRNAVLVHYSTDYVFNGGKRAPWTEDDQTGPLNAYGAGKLAGEEGIQQIGGRYLILRTSWVYGPHGNNFLLTMLRLGRERDQLKIVDDQIGSPTTSMVLADTTRTILDGIAAGRFGSEESWAGLYHLTCSGSVSWCGFAQAIFERAGTLLDGKMPAVTPIPSSEYPTPARRPHYSVLSCDRLQQRFGVQLPPWQSALDAVIQELSARRVPA